MIGQKIAHYRITAAIGAGGMGQVYRATDTKLGRDVALKVLPPEMASSPERLERFQREARAVAALNHPHVVTIYSVEEADGIHFLTMELVDGEPLDRLIPAGGMAVSRMLEIAGGLADALCAAHDKGIIHRDLKPANVMFTKAESVKVLDFGLARMTARAETTHTRAEDQRTEVQTSEGVVMGTMPYMSPEQLHGQALDHRTDIFSLGIMLYEMACGERPFRGDSSIALASAILRDTPRPLLERRKDLPEGLSRIISRCLEKSASDRFPSARDLRGALGGVMHTGPGSVRSASIERAVTSADEGLWIAVLPFKCIGADADLAALADGLCEEIATGLARFRYLSVVSGASAGARPDARYVLEGSMRVGGSAIRVSAQLVDTQSGARIWSETFNRDLQASSFFAVQDDLSARIVATVGDSYGVLVHSMRSAMRQKDDAALTPAEWQFEYFAYREQITPVAHAALKGRLGRALERNDRQSNLYACLAQVYVDEYAFGFGDDETSLDRALAAARRAVELDRANQFALVALAQTHFFRQDLAAFGPAAKRAMALNPLNTDAVGILGLQIVHTGEFARGAAIVRRAMDLNANHAGWMHFAPLWEHFHNGEYEQALERANRVDVPGLFWPFLVMAAACGHLGRRAEAEAAVRDLLALDPEFAAHARSNIESWHFASGLLEPLLEGLRKAGLSIPQTDGTSDSQKRIGTIAEGTNQEKLRTDSGQLRSDEGFGVAVMPFKFSGARSELEALAAGLTEDIVTGFSRFTYLRVRSAGKELGARYVMEGTLRQAGTKVRLAVQLVDTESGARIWAETYERPLDPDAAFELQDDLVHRIVGTCADRFGVLARSISDAVRGRDPAQLGPYEALMRGFGYHHRLTETEHAAAREVLERAVDRAPSNADCWAMLSWIISQEHGHGFNPRSDSLDRALAAARRAVDLAPSSPLAQQALAVVSFFRKETGACLSAAERALALNPLDTSNEAMFLIAFTGDWDRGCALIRRAMELNPHHPRWYELTLSINEYRLGNYRATVNELVRANAREIFWTNLMLAAAHAQLGEHVAARDALRELLAQKADFAQSAADSLSRWFDPLMVAQLIEGLRKAGLEVVAETSNLPAPPAPISGAIRAEEGFWVAVLPFKYSGANAELTALAEGLTEDIVTGLSRFSYLRVIARGSTAGYSSESGDPRAAGKALGARYVIEGSLRRAGARLRLAVQLVDANSGAHLWAENFERAFSPETLFELQDDLVPRIVSTVADMYGVLPRSMSEALRGKPEEELTPHEAVLCAFGYMERVTPEEHVRVRRILERAVSIAPNQSNCWAMLANLYWEEYAHELNPLPDSLGRALAAARNAVDAAPSNNLAHYALAGTLFFQKDFLGFRAAAERALELNRMDASVAALLGNLLAYAGDWERGCAVVESAMRLNPHHPGWYWFVLFNNAYRQRDYRGALGFALKINLPGNYFTHAVTAAAYGQLGMREAARKTLQELLEIRPDFAEAAREEFGRWNDPEFVEHLIDGLRKAGLDVPSEKKAEDLALESSTPSAPISGAVRADEGFWVAVLPFKYSGANADLTVLSEGLTEEIVTGLSRFSYLRVIARGSNARFKNETIDIRSVGKELGARYVMEGSLRQAGSALRVAVQLVDASTGAHLWAETYERTFRQDDLFALQDDLVPRIVSTVADWYGVLPHTMSEFLRSKAPDQLSPYEAVLRSFGYSERVTAEEHAAVRIGLERAVEQAPGNADCWAMLSMVYGEEYRYGFNAQPDPLGRSVQAARRAADASPSNHLAWLALAQALFYRKELEAFRNAAERAIALNPMDGYTLARMGLSMAFLGDWERGCELAERATQLNPNHPGWYWAASFNNAYRKADYRGALSVTLKMNMPGFFFHHMNLAAVYGQLGERELAGKALQELLVLKPDFALEARAEIGKFVNSELVEHMIDGLSKAGLDVPAEKKAGDSASGSSKPSAPISGAVRADEGFWVAVLPFKYSGANAELTVLAEGLTEDIVTGLSRFSYLRVIARSSTLRYASESVDVRSAGKELGARYVMEGSLRQAGTKLRLAVQLVDAVSGAHLWAENYERTFNAESVFELQDELVPRIVSTVADANGILARSMSEAVRSRDPEQLTPYEAVLRSFGYGQRITPEELSAARTALEFAVQKAPAHADAWAMLAWLNTQDYAQGFNLKADSLASGLTAAQRAVDAAPSNQLAWSALAQALFFQKEFQSFRNAAERAVTLNPMDGNTIAFLGELLNYAGDWERGLALAGRAKQLNPNYPGWYWYADFYDAYRRGDDRAALDFALKINLPGQWFSHAVTAAALGQLGEADAATKAVRELLKLRPDFVSVARKAIAKWWESEYIERMIDGWRKAGLEIAGEESSAPSASRAAPAQVSIAVLPFSDMSAAKDQEYLCEGMAEEIMNALVRIDGIRVASRTSAIRAAKSGDDLGAISRALSVGHVLEGSVRSAGSRLRVTAQLTDAASGYQLWSERFDREAIDVFAIQDEIAAGVVGAVKSHLAPGTRTVQARPQTHNLDAYRSYLKGRHLRGIEDFAGATSAFEGAVRLDPAHAPSWTALAEITVLSAHMGMIMPRAACTAARKMLATARELQGESADGLHVEAFAAFLERRWDVMESSWRSALELQPNHVLALGSFAITLCGRQRLAEALPLFERAREADPLASFPYTLAGWGLLMSGKLDDGLRQIEDALSFEKEDASAIGALCIANVALGRFEQAIDAGERGVAVTRRAPFFLGILGWALAAAGRDSEARAVLEELQARPAGSPTAVSEAWLLGALGGIDDAFDVLARADEEHQGLLCYTGLPGFDSLRSDARFAALLQRLGLSPSND